MSEARGQHGFDHSLRQGSGRARDDARRRVPRRDQRHGPDRRSQQRGRHSRPRRLLRQRRRQAACRNSQAPPGQPPRQHRPCPRQAAGHGALGQAKLPGRLPAGQALQVAQHDHVPVVSRQPAQLLVQHGRQVDVRGLRRGRFGHAHHLPLMPGSPGRQRPQPDRRLPGHAVCRARLAASARRTVPSGLLLGGFACQLTQGAGSVNSLTHTHSRWTNAAATVSSTGSALLGRCTHYRRAERRGGLQRNTRLDAALIHPCSPRPGGGLQRYAYRRAEPSGVRITDHYRRAERHGGLRSHKPQMRNLLRSDTPTHFHGLPVPRWPPGPCPCCRTSFAAGRRSPVSLCPGCLQVARRPTSRPRPVPPPGPPAASFPCAR